MEVMRVRERQKERMKEEKGSEEEDGDEGEKRQEQTGKLKGKRQRGSKDVHPPSVTPVGHMGTLLTCVSYADWYLIAIIVSLWSCFEFLCHHRLQKRCNVN